MHTQHTHIHTHTHTHTHMQTDSRQIGTLFVCLHTIVCLCTLCSLAYCIFSIGNTHNVMILMHGMLSSFRLRLEPRKPHQRALWCWQHPWWMPVRSAFTGQDPVRPTVSSSLMSTFRDTFTLTQVGIRFTSLCVLRDMDWLNTAEIA